MNIELMRRVRDQITAFPEKWDQHSWASEETDDFSECGTTACIAGWAVALHTGESNLVKAAAKLGHSAWDTDLAAAKALGLDAGEARGLFYTYSHERALDVLETLIKDGENA